MFACQNMAAIERKKPTFLSQNMHFSDMTSNLPTQLKSF